MTHGSKLFQRERLPTVSEIVEVIRTMPYHVEQCVYVGRGPLPEVWIDVMGVWIDVDGRRFSGDRNRGFGYPGRFGAWRLRRALRYAKKAYPQGWKN